MAAPDGDIGLQLVLDQPGGHDDGPIADDDPWAKFTLPFPVGTIEDLEQRCYFNEEGLPEWLWSRAHAFLHISSEGWRYLHLNQAKIKQHFVNCQIDVGEFRYRPKEGSEHICKWKDHTFMSRRLLAMLLFICQIKPLSQQTKNISMKLLFDLVSRAHQFMCQHRFGGNECKLAGMVISKHTGAVITETLSFSQQSFCSGWDKLLSHSPGAQRLWTNLRKRESGVGFAFPQHWGRLPSKTCFCFLHSHVPIQP